MIFKNKVLRYFQEDSTGERLDNWSIIFMFTVLVLFTVYVYFSL